MHSTILPILMIAGGFGVSIALILWMFRQARKEKEHKRQLAFDLGFRPLNPIPVQVSERTLSDHPAKFGQFELLNVAGRITPEGDFYLFDLWSTGGRESCTVEQGSLAVISPSLKLPRFSIFPKVPLPGGFGNLANKALSWITSLSLPAITMAEQPEFDRRYFLNTDFEAVLRQVITPQGIVFLIRTPGLVLYGQGDTLVVSRMKFRAGRSRPTAKALNVTYHALLRLFSLFSRTT